MKVKKKDNQRKIKEQKNKNKKNKKVRMMQIDNKYKERQETKAREVVIVPFKGREEQE